MAIRSNRIDKQAFSKEYFTVNVRTHTNYEGPATQNAVCRSGLRSLSAAECYILSRLF